MNGFPAIKVNALEFARNAKVRIGTSHAGQHSLKPQECSKRLCNWENRGDAMLTKTKAEEVMRVSYSQETSQTIEDIQSSTILERQGKLLPTTSLAERKTTFLRNLKSPIDNTRYKRYTGAPIRYAGGKSLAVGLIVELIPDTVKKIVSPFLGGGSVEVTWSTFQKLNVGNASKNVPESEEDIMQGGTCDYF